MPFLHSKWKSRLKCSTLMTPQCFHHDHAAREEPETSHPKRDVLGPLAQPLDIPSVNPYFASPASRKTCLGRVKWPMRRETAGKTANSEGSPYLALLDAAEIRDLP